MSRNLFLSITNIVKYLERMFLTNAAPPAPALAYIVQPHSDPHNSSFSLRELIGDGILWAVPKHRRSVEKRLNRKFGHPDYVWKPLKEKRNLRSCLQCGNDHEMGVLCPHCYAKVRDETQLMQDKIQAQLGLEPIEQEVIVLYEGETTATTEEQQGKRIVEMKKPRPMWFTKNLLQKSTQQSSNEIKPTNLG
ncbi:39S ribosomal protein L32, mitochondrial [Drosophila grimshawi]|uniref:Large ribosomal subunit protein bL32m n=1 Tax=Drosophila grimshawi TaxID=7222 RepID=B4JI22_DROGR|nr:39S ribosomal protein L32, mitochondrial [Drosophila grimshawi]EDV93942.1 GH18009 [Drosophila grimshawi]